MASPLEQFVIKPILSIDIEGYNFSFTNSSLFMVLALALGSFITYVGTRKVQSVPSRAQGFVEVLYGFINDLVVENTGQEGKKFVPLILTIFLFILSCNLLGMIPSSFTVTSHITVNLAISMLLMLVLVAYGFKKHGIKFLSLFWPKGVFAPIAAMVALLEVVSFLIRPFSLAIRLAANMIAGHILLKIFAGFCVSLIAYSGFVGITGSLVSMLFLIIIIGIEFFIAILQAYIFVMLASIYLNDAVNMH